MMKRYFNQNRIVFQNGGSSEMSAEKETPETKPATIIPEGTPEPTVPPAAAKPQPAMPQPVMPQQAPEAMPGQPQAPQGPEAMKPVTAEDLNKATQDTLDKSQKLYQSGIRKIDILANIKPEQINIPA